MRHVYSADDAGVLVHGISPRRYHPGHRSSSDVFFCNDVQFWDSADHGQLGLRQSGFRSYGPHTMSDVSARHSAPSGARRGARSGRRNQNRGRQRDRSNSTEDKPRQLMTRKSRNEVLQGRLVGEDNRDNILLFLIFIYDLRA